MTSTEPHARRPATFGPEPAGNVAGHSWCWWDLWCCAVAVLDHDGDINTLAVTVSPRIDAISGGRAAEATWSHLMDLAGRLRAAGLAPGDLVSDRLNDKRFVARAREKLVAREHDGRAFTPAMHNTPRHKHGNEVRFGAWDNFPVSPRTFYEQLAGGTDRWVSKDASQRTCSALERRCRKLAKGLNPAEELALHRAFHTVWCELQERGDDSYGAIGDLRSEAWKTYITLNPQAASMDPAVWWTDLADLVVWDDYALTHQIETLHWLPLPTNLIDVIDRHLTALADTYDSVHLHQHVDAHELAEGFANRHPADRQRAAEFAFRRNLRTGRVLTRGDAVMQEMADLPIKRQAELARQRRALGAS